MRPHHGLGASLKIPIVETKRLLLRPPLESDLQEWADHFFGDPDVARYISKRPLTPYERAERALRVARESWALNGVGGWVLADKGTGAFLGAINIDMPEEKETAGLYIGYGLIVSAWGQGYATEAAGAATRYTFEYTENPRLIATVMQDNYASSRVLLKLGYSLEEGEFPQDGLLYYVLRKEDYQVSNADFRVM